MYVTARVRPKRKHFIKNLTAKIRSEAEESISYNCNYLRSIFVCSKKVYHKMYTLVKKNRSANFSTHIAF